MKHDRFSRTGGAGDKQVRHLFYIREYGLAGHVLAEAKSHRAAVHKFRIGNKRAQMHDSCASVRDLNTDKGLTGNRRFDANRVSRKRKRQILVQRGDARKLPPLRGPYRKTRYFRPHNNIGDVYRYAEAIKRPFNNIRACLQISGARFFDRPGKQIKRRCVIADGLHSCYSSLFCHSVLDTESILLLLDSRLRGNDSGCGLLYFWYFIIGRFFLELSARNPQRPIQVQHNADDGDDKKYNRAGDRAKPVLDIADAAADHSRFSTG